MERIDRELRSLKEWTCIELIAATETAVAIFGHPKLSFVLIFDDD